MTNFGGKFIGSRDQILLQASWSWHHSGCLLPAKLDYEYSSKFARSSLANWVIVGPNYNLKIVEQKFVWFNKIYHPVNNVIFYETVHCFFSVLFRIEKY